MTEAVILAGGFGTRLRNVVADRPKPMALIAGRPFLEWQLEALAEQGVVRVVLAIGYMGQLIQQHFGSRWQQLQIAYAVEDEPLGTGGAIRNALTMCSDPRVFALNGDTFSGFPFQNMMAAASDDSDCIIAVAKIPDAYRSGTVVWSESANHGIVSAFRAKGLAGPAWINTGTYLVTRQAFLSQTREGSFSMESDFLEKACEKGKLLAVPSNSTFIDIGIPEDYEKAQAYIPAVASISNLPDRRA